MGTVELKSNLHELIDGIQNPKLLKSLYEILTSRKNSQNGGIWKSLTSEQQKEVLDAYEESENPDNLISHEQVLKELK
ncbi:MAG TPA: hypothetical protein PKL31_04425 [Fulvivirga sp.]|nr:hypothetical protein [Fulvivirga sp.]